MRTLARLVSAALALLIIAGLTSTGLYAIVAGGLFNTAAVGRSGNGGAPVLVTIQAGSSTATPSTTAGDVGTPGPTPGIRGGVALASPGAVAPGPASSGSAPTTSGASAASGASTASGSGASGSGSSGSGPSTGGAGAGASSNAPDGPSAARRGARSGQPGPTGGQQSSSGPGASHEGLAAEIVDVEHDWQPINLDGTSIGVQAGLDIVTVWLQMTNTSGELRYVGEGDLLLVGADGTRYAPRPSPLAREPRMLTMPILPGDVVRGWQTFAVPPGVTIARAQWNPSRADRTPAGAAFNLELPR